MTIRDRVKELRQVRASEIHGSPWNWRVHGDEQRAATAGSMEELGIFTPLDCYEKPDGTVWLFDGHLRQEILEGIGPNTMVPINVTDLTEDEAKKANVIKDPLAGLAEANQQALGELLAGIETEHEGLREMLDGLAEVNDIVLPSFDEMPKTVEDNITELEHIRSQRQRGNEKVADKHDTERYLVIVFPTRTAREQACRKLGLPEDERYVPFGSVRLSSRLSGIKQSSGFRTATKRHSGDAG